MSSAVATTEFLLPPVVHNARGEVRKAGFELEYSGLSINLSASLVRTVFGGEHVALSTFCHRVRGSRAGAFGVEIDTSFLKDQKYEPALRALNLDPNRHTRRWLEARLLETFALLVPIEIGSPPIPITDLAPLDELRRRLCRHGAKGTRASVFYAFGMHINPEIPSDDPGLLRDYLRAFVLLYPWLKQEADVDVTRSFSPYINPFPTDYVKLILRDGYPSSRDRLIDDYIEHNPTRNRPLDMLPVLSHLDADRVMDRVQDRHLVKPRPAFHYRLPNCLVDEPGWTLAHEWNLWVAVEHLAHDPARLAEMSRDYFRADEASFRPFVEKWPDVVKERMRGKGRMQNAE
jgi:hypothetical protein